MQKSYLSYEIAFTLIRLWEVNSENLHTC